MPFGPYSDFKDCVSKNGDKTSPEGFCSWLHHEITGNWPGEMTAGLPEELQSRFWTAFGEASRNNTPAEALAIAEGHVIGWERSNGSWVKENEMNTRSVVGVEIFAAGTHNGDLYTEQDLDSMVMAFHELKGRVDPPLKVGHSSDEFNTELAKRLGVPEALVIGEDGKGAMALGWIASLRRVGSVLVADFSDVPNVIAELIERKSYAPVSAEILFNIVDRGKTYPRVLSGVAILGAELPAVRDIAGLETAAVYVQQRKPDAVIEFSAQELTYDDLEPDLRKVEQAMESVIRGRRGAVIFRTLWRELVSKAKGMFAKRMEHKTAEDRMSDKQEFQGEKPPKAWWDNCISHARTWQGVNDPEAFCGSVWYHNRPALRDSFTIKEDEMDKAILVALGLPETATAEEALEAAKGLKADGAKLQYEQIAAALGLAEDATMEEIVAAINSLKEAAAAQPAAAQAQFSELQGRVTRLQADLAAAHDRERVAHFTEMARGWQAISGTPDEIGAHLADLEKKAGSDVASDVAKRYDAQNQQLVAAGVFSSKGTPAEGDVDKTNFDKAVEKVMADDPAKTYNMAFNEVRKTQPRLYKEHRKAGR